MTHKEACSALDGNAAGGLLREIFVFDATAARVRCAGCAGIAMVGELRLYAIEMGAILRCPTCDVAVLRIAPTPRGLWLDLRGTATLVAMSGRDDESDPGPSTVLENQQPHPRPPAASQEHAGIDHNPHGG